MHTAPHHPARAGWESSTILSTPLQAALRHPTSHSARKAARHQARAARQHSASGTLPSANGAADGADGDAQSEHPVDPLAEKLAAMSHENLVAMMHAQQDKVKLLRGQLARERRAAAAARRRHNAEQQERVRGSSHVWLAQQDAPTLTNAELTAAAAVTVARDVHAAGGGRCS